MTWSYAPALAHRVLKISDALKVAYRQDEIENIRLVISEREAIEYRNQLEMNRGYQMATERPVPLPIPGRLWVTVYGVEVWIKDRS